MGISNISQFNALFSVHDVTRVVIKPLSERQDNTKNQIVLGSQGAFNLIPCEPRAGRASESRKKRKSAAGEAKLEASLEWFWLREDDSPVLARNAKLIDYFQYPEIRLSGFFRGTRYTHRALRRDHQLEYGKRYLAFGFNQAGQVFGLVLTERDDAFAREFDFSKLDSLPGFEVLLDFTPHYTRTNLIVAKTNEELLIDALAALVEKDHPGVRLTPKGLVTFNGKQVSGYTLEALLGVVSNAKKEPDKFGYEMKAFTGGKVSLCTPTADLGFEGANGFRSFMNKYGKVGADGKSKRFTGVYRVGEIKNGFRADLHGVDDHGVPTVDPNDVCFTLTDIATGEIISGWSLQKLLQSWTKKHAFACYVPSIQIKAPGGGYLVRFKPDVFICHGTTVFRFLAAMKKGIVYFDPAHTIRNDTGEMKVRPQFRVSTAHQFGALKSLYDTVISTRVLP